MSATTSDPDLADRADRVLAGELSGAVEQAREDVNDLAAVARQTLVRLADADPHMCKGDANRLGQTARTAVMSLMQVAIVRGKIEGLALCRSVQP